MDHQKISDRLAQLEADSDRLAQLEAELTRLREAPRRWRRVAALGSVLAVVAVALVGSAGAAPTTDTTAVSFVSVPAKTVMANYSIPPGATASAAVIDGTTTVPSNATTVRLAVTVRGTAAGTISLFPAGNEAGGAGHTVSWAAGATATETEAENVGLSNKVSVKNSSTKAAVVTLKITGYSTQVTGGGIADETITSADVANDSLTGYDVGFNTIDNYNIQDETLRAIDIKDGSIGGSDIADGSINGNDIDLFNDNRCTLETLLGTAQINADPAVPNTFTPYWIGYPHSCSGATVAVRRISAGQYVVSFSSSIQPNPARLAVVTQNTSNGALASAVISVESLQPGNFFVQTRVNGAHADVDFTIMAF